MNQLYPDVAPGVNWNVLSRSCISFYRWIYRWYQQTGDVSPSTDYLAHKQKRTPRTVYRWLAALEAEGAIQREVIHGVERSIVPLVEPPPKPSRKGVPPPFSPEPRSRRFSSSRSQQNVTGVVSSPSCIDADTQDATTQTATPGVVASLVAEGVFPNVAAQLVEQLGETPVLEQLQALPHRKPKDRAAVLVSSIKQSWPLPAAFVQAVERKRKEAAEAAQRAARATLEAKRASQRVQASTAFKSLSEAARSAFLSEACEALRKEQPAAYRLMYGKAGFDAWVAGRAQQLVAAKGGLGSPQCEQHAAGAV